MKTLKTVQGQSTFCTELMNRLNEKIKDAKVYNGKITYHTLMQYGYER